MIFKPTLFVSASARYTRSRPSLDVEKNFKFVIPLNDQVHSGSKNDATSLNFTGAKPVKFSLSQLDRSSKESGSDFELLPESATRLSSYDKWATEIAGWIYREKSLVILHSSELKKYSDGIETERDFLVRLNLLARECRDEKVDKLRERYKVKFDRLKKQINTAERVLQREQRQADDARLQSAFNIGSSLLGAFVGRRKSISGNIRRASSAARSASRAARQSQDVEDAKDRIHELNGEFEKLEGEFKNEMQALEADMNKLLSSKLKQIEIRPKKSEVEITDVALVWAPARLK